MTNHTSPEAIFNTDYLGGIPTRLLAPGTSELARCKSGAEVLFSVADDEIMIDDLRGVRLWATTKRVGSRFDGVLELRMHFKRPDGTKHPDFDATALTPAIIRYFDHHLRGVLDIRYILDEYRPHADTHAALQRSLARTTGINTTLADATDEDGLYALSRSPMGLAYERQGFYPIGIIESPGGTIWAAFERPDLA